MNTKTTSLLRGALLPLSLAVISSVILLPLPVSAQERAFAPQVRTSSGSLLPLEEITAQMRRGEGVIVLADSTICTAQAPPLRQATTRANVDRQVKALIKDLPTGTLWVKIYLPEPNGKRWDADAVTQYVQAQARMLGRSVGADTPSGVVEILGAQVPADKAHEVIKSLNLKLVYLFTNPKLSPLGSQTLRDNLVQRIRQMDSPGRVWSISISPPRVFARQRSAECRSAPAVTIANSRRTWLAP